MLPDSFSHFLQEVPPTPVPLSSGFSVGIRLACVVFLRSSSTYPCGPNMLGYFSQSAKKSERWLHAFFDTPPTLIYVLLWVSASGSFESKSSVFRFLLSISNRDYRSIVLIIQEGSNECQSFSFEG